MESNSPTKSLAKFAAELEYGSIPPQVIDHIKMCVLDTLGVGLFGSTLPWAKKVAEYARELDGVPKAIVWGSSFKVNAPNAALANATMVHSFELDDLHKASIVHPGSVVLAPVLAMAEHIGGCNGKELLTAVVTGYEVGCRVGMCLGTPHLMRGFHPTGTHGTFAAGAAAGRILRLDAETMVHCLGIAGTQAAGLMAAQEGAEVKRLHAGRAAQSGIYAAQLAQRGFTGITNILEAKFGGYGTTMSSGCYWDMLTAGLGEDFETARVGFKPYSAGGSTHTGHEAVKSIMQKNALTADMIDKVVIHSTTVTYNHTYWDYKPAGVTAAQMNLPYVIAVTALEGDIFVDQFTEAKVKDPKIIEYTRKVEVLPNPELDKLGEEFRHAVIAEVKTKDGRTFTERVDTAKGSVKRPMTTDEVVGKYRILAGKVLTQKSVEKLLYMVQELEKVTNVNNLAKLLVP